MEQFIATYIIPSGILLFAVTYLISQVDSRKKSGDELKIKRLTLIEKLQKDFSRINNLFESLRMDAELRGYFDFKNINNIRPMVLRIQEISTDDLVIFEGNERLRREIINICEFLPSLFSDVDSLENIANAQTSKYNEITENFNNDLKKLRSELIPFGIQITPFHHVTNPTNKSSDKHYNAALSSLSELKSNYDKGIENIKTMENTLKDRRYFYSLKCLDCQNQLRLLLILLEDARKEYSKKSLISSIFHL